MARLRCHLAGGAVHRWNLSVGAYFDNCNVPSQGPAGLSTEPAQLLNELVQRYERGHLDLAGTVGTVACMLQATGYPPLRAALYRALERLPGVQLLGWRQDRVGRRGVAIAVTEHGMREVLLIDPATANALELDQIQVTQPPFKGSAHPSPAPERHRRRVLRLSQSRCCELANRAAGRRKHAVQVADQLAE